ncbi:Sodium-coupled neutral amino acid transporter 2 [Morella rubra]|uniref:Sodium-coupled neutral amino acid transporter 2 n=1 Tax=Morella rubra TaxID=262757 RepID=A0A6A1VFB6_9ROSI|nr:Sodium-coupled neutral amino acid transporter 2 [Morella rubra]
MSGGNKQIVDERVHLLPRNEDYAEFNNCSGASFHASVFNLSCTIVGAGIMSLPATLKVLGLVPGIVLIIFAAFLTEASVEMLLRFSKPGSAFTYGDVMGDAFGMFGKMLLQTTIVINNIGAVIIYLIIIDVTVTSRVSFFLFLSYAPPEDLLSGATSIGVHHKGVLEEWFGEHWWTGRAFVLIALTVIVFFPLMCFKRIESLKYTSAISFALVVVFLVVVIGITMYKLAEGSIETPRLFPNVTDLTSFCNLFTAAPPVVCAYVCHFNGCFGFLLFGDSTISDVLSNFDSNIGIPYGFVINDIVRVCYACHIILIFPIIFYPLRLNLDGLLFPSAMPLASDNQRFAFISALLTVIVLLGAIFIPSIWVAFQFCGATVGILLGFVFPASITLNTAYFRLTKRFKSNPWLEKDEIAEFLNVLFIRVFTMIKSELQVLPSLSEPKSGSFEHRCR